MQDTKEKFFVRILGSLNEAQSRWFVAREALSLRRGGIAKMHALTGISRKTILRGIRELKSRKKIDANDRIRRKGGGRESISYNEPLFIKTIEEIMKQSTAGDPMGPLLWTYMSTEKIAAEMKKHGFDVSNKTIQRRLVEMDYTLQSNSKTRESSSPEERNSQFLQIEKTVNGFIEEGNPVISVDAKKKEKIGNFKNNGRTWRKKRNPIEVNMYDFPNLSEGNAIPYGAYDIARNEGFVNVGTSSNTAEFAVNSIRQWWKMIGSKHYPYSKKILVCADGGGSNGSKNRLWKYSLQVLSNELSREIHVCHYPRGASKWNKIEHRMFSFISLNWRGKPLTNYQVVIKLIGSTSTKTGLKIKAILDKKDYMTGIKISDDQMGEINIKHSKTNPKWNYRIMPLAN